MATKSVSTSFAVAIVGWLLSAGAVAAQTTTGTLRGVVKDTSGAVLPGVWIALTSESQIGGEQAAHTDQAGQFRLQGLSPGVYTIRAAFEGFRTTTHEDVRVEVGRTFDLDFILEVGSLEQRVTVTGDSPVVDASKTAVTMNYTQEFVKNLPVTRFSVFDFFQMTPGISPTQVHDSYQSSAFGSNTNENQYQIDGTDITSPASSHLFPYPNTDIVEELEVVGAGASAEYGGMQGAVFNIVTKSGGNDLKGLSNWFSQYQALTGGNTPDEEFSYHRDRFNDATVQIGGPFKRDQLWWFGSYQYRRDSFAEPGTDPRYLTEDLSDRVFGKLTWQVRPHHRLMFALHDDYSRVPSTITPSTPAEASSISKGQDPTPTATWQMLLNDRMTFELRYGGFYNWSSDQGLTHDLTTPGVFDEVTRVNSANVSTASFWNATPIQTGVATKLTRFVTIAGQHHEQRAGVQFRHGRNQIETVWPGGRRIFLSNGQPSYIDVREPGYNGGSVLALAFYADDSWTVTGRIALNLGVRFDANKAWIQDMPKVDASLNRIGTVEGIDDLIDWKHVSPRIGATIRLRENGRSILRASYGRYYQNVTTSLFSFLSPALPVAQRFGWNAETMQYDILQQTTRSSQSIEPDLRQPFTDQYAVGIDYELLPNLAVGASYIHKRGEDLLGTVDVGSTFAPRPFTDPQTGHVLTVFNRVTPPQDVRILLTNPGPGRCSYCVEEFRQRYNGLLLTLTKRMSKRWQAIASLTVSRTEGLHSGSSGGTAGSQSSNPSGSSDDPNELINAFGLLSGDRDVMWKLQSSYVMPYAVVVSTNWQWIAGRPYTRRFNLTGLNQGSVTVLLEPRNGSLRMPAQNFVDVRVEKRVSTAGRRLTLFADLFNLLNIDTPLGLISENVGTVSGGAFRPNRNFGVGDTVANPRRAMLGVRFEF